MWAFTDTARAALRGGHTLATQVQVWHSGQPTYLLEATGGNVTANADQPVLRNLGCKAVDPTGQLATGDVGNLLNSYDCEIAIFRGVEYGPAGQRVRELAPQGVFKLTARQVLDSTDGLTISLTGQDRAMGYQGPMDSALAISAGTPIEDAITRLLATRNAGVTLDALKTGFTCGPLLYAADIDVWSEAQDLATSVGAVLFHDRTGQARLALAGAPSDRPVTSYEEGDGLLQDVDKTEDSDTIVNSVRMESASGLIYAVAEDTNPSSPTYVRGRYGKHPKTIVNQHLGSVEQAQQAATARLAYELGRSETVTFTAVPNPAQDVQEVTAVHRPRIDLVHRALVVATLDMPLTATELMKVGCRKSVRAQDGAILPPTALVP